MNKDLLKSHAKSFYWASFFLSKEIYSKCSALSKKKSLFRDFSY